MLCLALVAGCTTEPLEKDRRAIASVMKLVTPEQFGHVSGDVQKAAGDSGVGHTQRTITVDFAGTAADAGRELSTAMGKIAQCDSRGTSSWSCLGEQERINVHFATEPADAGHTKLQLIFEGTR